MATYKAVMRPALEYASSIWSPLASSTSINKLQVMQNTALRTATGCTQDTNIQNLHDETVTLPIHNHLQLHASQYTTSITSTTQTHNILQHSKAKKSTIFNNGCYTTNIPTDPHTVTTTVIKTNMRHIHTSIVSRHLATRGNNKIMCTLAQLRTNKSPSSNHTYTKSTSNHIHHHYAHYATPTHHLFNCTHIRTTLSPLDLWTDPAGVMEVLARWRDRLAGGPKAA